MVYLSALLKAGSHDSYHISIESLSEKLLSDQIKLTLRDQIDLVGIYLEQLSGSSTTSIASLGRIAEIIAECFMQNPNIILCYYCDFISMLPSTRKAMPVQEYRSKLFQKLFNRYVAGHHVNGVSLVIIEVNGVDETNYVHIITREVHMKYVSLIGEEIRKDYGK